jgi:OPA family glycerol-3-phosphate transporter-like MFS transporter/OPA family sugar phosphate sensor protein UhpC-like MFS transporter
MCQHLYPYSERGQRKRDYQSHYSDHNPWQPYLKEFNEYFTRLGYIIANTGDWRYCFWLPAAIAATGVVFVIITLRDTPKSVGLPELENTKTELDDNDSPEAFRAFLRKKVFRNPIIWVLAVTDLFVYVVRFAVLDWGPTFLQDRANPLSPELAGWTLAIFEIAGCAGMLCAG